MERVVRHFQEELEILKTRLLEMGGLAEERVRRAVQGLAERDLTMVDGILGGDVPVLAASGPIDTLTDDLVHRHMAV